MQLRGLIPYIYIIVVMFIVFSTLADILVSYTLFRYATDYFIKHEASELFVSDLLTRGYPYITLIPHIIYLSLYSVLTYLALRVTKRIKKFNYKNMVIYASAYTCFIMSSIIGFYIGVAHIFGALSWLM